MQKSTVVIVLIAMLIAGVPGSAQTLAEGERVRITRQDAGAAGDVSQELGEFLAAPDQRRDTAAESAAPEASSRANEVTSGCVQSMTSVASR